MSSARRLSEIIGNERLLRILRKGELPQAALFAGPEGVGKKTIALLLAAKANCHSPVGNDLCGVCGSCVRAAAGNHPDILLFQVRPRETKISVDDMRRLNEEAQYRPFEGRFRFFVVDRAEKMSPNAANSILKTLEEPPSTSRIVLVTAFPHLILPTIRSRCQTFRFLPLERGEIMNYLETQTDLEQESLRASFSAGSIGAALSIDIEKTLDERDAILSLLQEWLEKRRFSVIFRYCNRKPLVSKMKSRDAVYQYLVQLELLCYDLYFLAVGTPERIVNQDRCKELGEMASTVAPGEISRLVDSVLDAKRDLERNVNSTICFQTLWLEALGHHIPGESAGDRQPRR
jgi:DNA polymerase-3 subunit delta'